MGRTIGVWMYGTVTETASPEMPLWGWFLACGQVRG